MRTPARRPPIRLLPVIALSLVLLVGGWTLLWFYARMEANATFAQWLATEQRFGRTWSCPGQRVGGYPLSITLSCDNPTFAGAVGDGTVEGTMAGLVAETHLYFPTNVVVTLGAPLRATDVATKQSVTATWSSGQLTLRGLLPNDLDRGILEVTGLQVRPEEAGAGAAVQVDRVEIGFKPVARAMDARADVEASLDAEGVRSPLLDASAGSSDPLALRFKGFATQVRFDGGTTSRDLLDPWLRAGGQVHIQSLEAEKGPMQLQAAGRFGLDEDHRLEGRLDASFTGLEPMAARFGLPLGMAKVGGALTQLLGGDKVAEPDPKADVTLPVTAKAGHLSIGPFRTGVTLEPLY